MKNKIILEEVVDTKTSLELVKTIIEHKDGTIIFFEGDELELSDIMKTGYLNAGFKEGILPDYIRDVYVDLFERGLRCYGSGDIVVNYKQKINHDSIKKQWEKIGYKTQKVKNSLKIIDNSNKPIASYGYNRLLIDSNRLDEFIEALNFVNG